MAAIRKPLNRREFLYYVWGTSIALFAAETIGALIWAVMPQYKAAEDCFACFLLEQHDFPQADGDPIFFTYENRPKFWLANIGTKTANDARHPEGNDMGVGLLALYPVCTHLGCLFKWHPSQQLFICPCHGSAFLMDGTCVHGPAPRDLDRFLIYAVDQNGEILDRTRAGNINVDSTVGQPLQLPLATTEIRIDDGKRLQGRQKNSPNTIP